MTVTRPQRPLSYVKMRRLVLLFSALLKEKRDGFTDFMHKLVSNQHLCQHSLDLQKILQPKSRVKREEERQRSLNSVNPAGCQAKPSDFDYLKVIGKGSFGKVLLARHRQHGNYYAVKVLQKQMIISRNEKHVMVERSVLLKGLQHPFLVGLHYSFQTPQTLYFVLDYVNGGEMFYHLQREGSFPEAKAAFYAAEMALALGYLHSHNIVYRDLKPENILLNYEGHVMLTDFGLCKEGLAAGGIMETFCGTPEYLAPEVLQGQACSPAVDWWGLGTVLFEMLFGLPPFYSRNTAEMFERILHAPLTLGSGVSQDACSLLEGLLEKDSSKRLGGNRDVEELQEHSFFASLNWEDLIAKRVTPPFIPEVTCPYDIRYIDPEFTVLPVPASVGMNGGYQKGGISEAFAGFSYMSTVEDKAAESRS